MSEDDIRRFSAQFEKAKKEFTSWPEWMRREARQAAATFPMFRAPASEGEQK
ncbi:hypothetical protein [Burkholderia pseudomallei]|uniref:hypothetical protein n=1 Tax=Burkholderia pseudomallei TaxID=28450 RepID=UPI0012F483E0|nr:hypothetical protein [Burkholderia pseudomallei]